MDAQVAVVAEDVQVAAKPRRRTYTAEYKRRILKEADACTTLWQRAPGAAGNGSAGGRCLSLGDYVTGRGATDGATAAGAC